MIIHIQCTHECAQMLTDIHAHMCTCACIYILTCTHIHTCTYILKPAHTHAPIHPCLQVSFEAIMMTGQIHTPRLEQCQLLTLDRLKPEQIPHEANHLHHAVWLTQQQTQGTMKRILLFTSFFKT